MLSGWFQYFLVIGGTCGPAFVMSLILTWLMIRWSPALGLVDRPTVRKNHGKVTPMGGGIAIAGATLLWFGLFSLTILLISSSQAIRDQVPEFVAVHIAGAVSKLDSLWLILVAAATICLVGLIDDRRGLPWQVRLLMQFGIAGFCVWWQGWALTAFINIPVLTGGLSILWIVALINSFNMLDNMDGLSAGVAMIVSISLAAFLMVTVEATNGAPQYFVAGLLWVLAGSLGGFLFFNRAPAKIFMGDTGSLFVGFLIAVATLLATYTGYQSLSPHRILAAPIALAVPFYDMISVVVIRLREGRSPFQADRCHLSHRLENMGMKRSTAVLTIYVLTGICCLCSITLSFVDGYGAVLLLAIVLLILLLVAMLEQTGSRSTDLQKSSETSTLETSEPAN